ncbi:hypothetical protein G7Y89_g13262 [Cudoniella acicularis]|uniref:Ubiquitin-like domain-containing protein n=1 Tax=Cudoniella acicularis TaxID=354080 RepID=A0A8H4RB27_9HELO|nr:hypothetical protein G7Y89_g13262 [Cudoniella acicularis]
MSMQTAGDIPLLVKSENSNSERRVTPSWTIGQLKAKLEPVTGIPPLSQKLILKLGSQQSVPIEAVDEENTQLSSFPLAPYAEILIRDDPFMTDGIVPASLIIGYVNVVHKYCLIGRDFFFEIPDAVAAVFNPRRGCYTLVTDIRPPGARPNYSDPSSVPKYELPTSIYETKTDSVLAWKKANKLGRFDPTAPSVHASRLAAYAKEVEDKGIEKGKRCRVGGEDEKRDWHGVDVRIDVGRFLRVVGSVHHVPRTAGWGA